MAKGTREGTVWNGTLQVEGTTDIRPELFYMLADAECPILELRQDKMSLEDIFLELTGSETEAEQAASEKMEEARKKRERFVRKEGKEEAENESDI